jgi:DHA1 family bicyclomycin/chloramphenicol resistance-like MFS transporter
MMARVPGRWIVRPTPQVPSSKAGLVALLGSMTALGAVAGDIYLPSLPAIADHFAVSDGGAQATVSLTLLGGAVGQMVIGPISDVVGRRRPVLAGLALHVIASIGIVLTPTLGLLLALRFCQGIGNAAAAVVALAVVRDLYTGSKAARLISQLMLVIGAAPLLAPSLGAVIAHWAGWRATFWFLAAFGLGLAALVYWRLPDTLPPAQRGVRSPGALIRGYRGLVRDRRFLALALIPGLGQSALMAWVVSSPFVVMEVYRLPEPAFPAIFAAGGICLVAGAQVNAGFVRRVGPRRLLGLALPVSLAVSVGLLGVSAARIGGLGALIGPMFVVLFLAGMVAPNASALAMSRHGDAAGSAAALIGTVQTAMAAGITGLVSAIGGGQMGLAIVVAASLSVAMAVAAGAGRVYRRQGPTPLP